MKPLAIILAVLVVWWWRHQREDDWSPDPGYLAWLDSRDEDDAIQYDEWKALHQEVKP